MDIVLGKRIIAEIAQLVEHDLAKVGVASSSLVSRSFVLTYKEEFKEWFSTM